MTKIFINNKCQIDLRDTHISFVKFNAFFLLIFLYEKTLYKYIYTSPTTTKKKLPEGSVRIKRKRNYRENGRDI